MCLCRWSLSWIDFIEEISIDLIVCKHCSGIKRKKKKIELERSAHHAVFFNEFQNSFNYIKWLQMGRAKIILNIKCDCVPYKVEVGIFVYK